MILGGPDAPHLQAGERTTLDDLFRIAGVRRPDALALCDPPDRTQFTDGEPRRLTYGQADHIVSAIAGRLRRLGLSTDAVVAVQMPNIVENTLTLLGILRAGMIAAPLPLLWRRADAAAVLNRLGAKAIVTASRVGTADQCAIAMRIAAEVFAVRYVCSFGRNLPDGVIPLDDLLAEAPLLDPPGPVARSGNPASHVAVTTFEVTSGGIVPVGRNHMELVAGGRAVQREARLANDAAILSASGSSSFAGLSVSTLPWLMTGGTLSLHHGFDPGVFAAQCRNDAPDAVVLPGPAIARIAEAGLLQQQALQTVLALWRAPERLSLSPPWPHPSVRMVDVLALGEAAVLCGSRTASGEPAEIPLGTVATPDGEPVLETTITQAGTLAVRGRMVPCDPFPPGAVRAATAPIRVDALGFVDTLFPCRADRGHEVIAMTGPPAGIVSVGGYRFALDRLSEQINAAGDAPVIAALPDAVSGHRLAGNATDRAAVRAALTDLGLNPLVINAFQERRKHQVA